jgi:hypothetical protein
VSNLREPTLAFRSSQYTHSSSLLMHSVYENYPSSYLPSERASALKWLPFWRCILWPGWFPRPPYLGPSTGRLSAISGRWTRHDSRCGQHIGIIISISWPSHTLEASSSSCFYLDILPLNTYQILELGYFFFQYDLEKEKSNYGFASIVPTWL